MMAKNVRRNKNENDTYLDGPIEEHKNAQSFLENQSAVTYATALTPKSFAPKR